MRLARFMASHRVVPLAALMLAGAMLLSSDSSVSAAGPGVLERLGDGGEGGVAISADGRFVAFTDRSVPDPFPPIVVRDRKAKTTEAIGARSWSNTGIAISADGRFVAFSSHEQLVPEDIDNCSPPGCPDVDVYVYDRALGIFDLISVASDETQGNGQSGLYDDIAISADGRYVTFASLASNLAPDVSGGIFIRDRLLGATEPVFATMPVGVSMSADGRFVAFDNGAFSSVFVLDRDTDKDGVYDEAGATETVLVSGASGGYWPAISDDGRFVAFHTVENFVDNVTLRDRQSGATTIVAETGHTVGGGDGTAVDLSSDGRFLAFASNFPLVPEDIDSPGSFGTDVYLYDQESGTLDLLSVAGDGTPGNADSASGFLSERLSVIALTPDGRYAAFHSGATNFLPGEGAGVFLAGTSLLGVVDTDGDGCSDKQELGFQPSLGGQRDLDNFWDLFDVPTGDPAERDGRVNILDIGAIVTRFGSTRETPPTKEEALAEALSPPPPAPAYHAASDRGGPIPGQELWNLLPPDGSIDIIDLGAAVVQFGHTCV